MDGFISSTGLAWFAVMYRSSYSDRIPELAGALANAAADRSWCIFDNTASSAAAEDALALQEALRPRRFA